MVQVQPIVVGKLQTNCYIVHDRGEAIVIDPGDEPVRIINLLKDLHLGTKLIVASHAHFDHVLGVKGLRAETHAPFAIHKADLPILESMQERVRQFMGFRVPPPPKPDHYLNENDTLKLGAETIRILHTPGHSPGSISLAGDGFVFTGDALFNQSIGRTDTPGGDFDMLIRSIKETLFKLDDETLVHPGHGPETTIGDEKIANPFVGRAARMLELR